MPYPRQRRSGFQKVHMPHYHVPDPIVKIMTTGSEGMEMLRKDSSKELKEHVSSVGIHTV